MAFSGSLTDLAAPPPLKPQIARHSAFEDNDEMYEIVQVRGQMYPNTTTTGAVSIRYLNRAGKSGLFVLVKNALKLSGVVFRVFSLLFPSLQLSLLKSFCRRPFPLPLLWELLNYHVLCKLREMKMMHQISINMKTDLKLNVYNYILQ